MKPKPREIVAGETIEFSYPFIHDTFSRMDEDGLSESKCWRPGVRQESNDHHHQESFADGIGQQSVTVVSVHKPGKFPQRVFFTRKWRDPSGKTFGKPNLHIISIGRFRSLIRGYRHDFELVSARVAQ